MTETARPFTKQETLSAVKAAEVPTHEQMLPYDVLAVDPPVGFIQPVFLVTERLDGSYYHPALLKTEATLRLSGLQLRPLASLAKVDRGRTPKANDYSDSGPYRIIKADNLSGRGIDWTSVPYITKVYFDALPSRFRLRSGDILISSIGRGSIGKVDIVSREGQWTIVSEVTVIRAFDVDPFYLTAFLRSAYGQCQIARHEVGSTGQAHLYPRDVKEILVPVLSKESEEGIGNKVACAEALRREADNLQCDAEQLLEKTLAIGTLPCHQDLAYWVQPSDLGLRLYAAFNHPRFSSVIAALRRSADIGHCSLSKLGETLKIVRAAGRPSGLSVKRFRYIDISSIDTATGIIAQAATIPVENAPSRAGKRVKVGQLLISTVRPSRGAIAVIPPEYDSSFASTGFAVVEVPDTIGKYYAHLILRSSYLIAQYERRVTGSMYPAISETELAQCLVPVIPEEPRAEINEMVAASQQKHHSARALIKEATTEVQWMIRGEDLGGTARDSIREKLL